MSMVTFIVLTVDFYFFFMLSEGARRNFTGETDKAACLRTGGE